MDRVAVVVPTRNRKQALAVTLRTILSQRDVDLQVVVVDDGSDDGTESYLGALDDQRLRVVRNDQPVHVARARNQGIEAADADWVAFCDDDDLWAPDKLARQLAAARDSRRDWVYTGAVSVDDDLQVLGGAPPLPPDAVVRLLPQRDVVPGGGSNVLARRGLLSTVGGFDPRLRNTEDWEMWIRLSKAALPAWLREPKVAKRVHSGGASFDVEQLLDGAEVVRSTHGERVDRGATYRWLAQLELPRGRRREALRYMAAAAVRGQAPGVAYDGWQLIRRRLTGRPAYRHPEWLAAAETWLGPLRAALRAEAGASCAT